MHEYETKAVNEVNRRGTTVQETLKASKVFSKRIGDVSLLVPCLISIILFACAQYVLRSSE